TWAARRDNDCHWLDDWVWNLHRVSGIIAIEWRAGLAVTGMGTRWLADDNWRAVLLGAGNDDAARGRGLYFSARSVRFSDWFPLWLDVVSRGSNRDDCCCGHCVRKVSGGFCHSRFT